MSDVLAPAQFESANAGNGFAAAGPPVGQSAQVLPVEKVLKAFRATYFDPVLSTTAPLPPHRWELQRVDDPTIFVRGNVSDEQGVSTIVRSAVLAGAAP